MMRGWEGNRQNSSVFKVLPRKRVLFVLNLTHDCGPVQFLPYVETEFFLVRYRSKAKQQNLSHQNTEVYAAS
jgi:hypothetical protein